MYLNIAMQCGGLAVLLLLLYFNLKNNSIGLYTEKFYHVMMVSTMVTTAFDILSMFAIGYMDSLPILLVHFVCKTYIAFLLSMAFLGYVYLCLDLRDISEFSRIRWFAIILFSVGIILIYALPINIFRDGPEAYTYGPSTVATYATVFSFVASIIYVSIKFKRLINKRRRRAIVSWMVVWLMAAVLQMINHRWLLVSFAGCMGMVIIFFELENPEADLDKETGAYNVRTMAEYMKQLFREGKKFSVLGIYLIPSREDLSAVDNVRKVLNQVVEFLMKNKKSKVFRSVEGELFVIYDSEDELEKGFDAVEDRFMQPWDIHDEYRGMVVIRPMYVKMPDSTVAEGPEEVFGLFRYYRTQKDIQAKNVFVIDEEMAAFRKNQSKTERAIVSALQEDRVEVFLQPIYSTEQNSFVSAEALARIRLNDGTYMSPAAFIPVAEERGLIGPIGERIFDKVCRFISEVDMEKYGIHYIEVNLSAKQCESTKLTERYINIMEKYNIDPSYINLEVTESASIDRRDQAITNMNELIDYGVGFSLDDFGNGQSNLNYVVDMPVSIVKFDKDMTQSYFEKEKAKYVLDAAIHMIHGMKLKMVAEGVETGEQLAEMTRLGVHYIQGYYFSKPLPVNEFVEFVKRENSAVLNEI